MIKFRAVTVDNLVSEKKLTDEFKYELGRVSNEIISDLMRPTATWEEKPTFQAIIHVTEKTIEMDVSLVGESPGNDHYDFLDEGTAEGVRISEAKHMVLPGTFSPKTIPGTLTANSGTSSDEKIFLPKGYPVVTKIEARKFTDAVAEIWNKKIEQSAVRVMHNIEKDLSG